MTRVKVLFVCMGNICRSPTAEGVFKRQVREAGLADRVLSDSAGTHDYHVGEAPDPRAQSAALRRGYDLSELCGRQISRRDFSEFDYVLVMDEANLRQLKRLCPPEHAGKVKLLMEFARNAKVREVPDPYYGGTRGFEEVLDMVEDASRGLLEQVRERISG
ncbi:MAG TPA: low molecular weight protein-tyrosine-phosphatase [Burkholderiales bacterium]|nr:low molecular weight protein-tyrosine-phosphatase [Burkholderiales bacterium]